MAEGMAQRVVEMDGDPGGPAVTWAGAGSGQ